MTKATIIPSLTNNPPSRANPDSFITDGDSFLNDLPDVVSGVNTVATELNTWNYDISELQYSAGLSATNASNSKDTSLGNARLAASCFLSEWVSGTTYSAGQIVYSNVDGRQYKRITAGAGTTDPSSDPTNWEPLGWEYITNYPDIRPTLDLNFAGSQTVDPRITFTRNSTATYFDKFGVMQTAGINQPRIDFDPVTGECKGLLIEEQRTNLWTYSEQFDDAAWSKLGGAITANVVPSPDGAIGADRLTEDTSTNLHMVYRVVPVTSGTVYTLSYWVKRGVGSRDLSIRMDSDASSRRSSVSLSTGAVSANASHTVTVRPFGSYWYVTCTVTATATTSVVMGAEMRVADVGTFYEGDGTSSIYIWGAQLEVGAFATSYIPTTTAQVTRAADSAVMTGTNFSSWYRQDEGTFYGEMVSSAALTGSSNRDAIIEVISGPLTEDAIGIGKNYAGGSPNLVFVGVKRSGAFEAFFAAPPTVSAGVLYKAAAAIRDNDVALSVNGVQPTTDTSVNIPKNIIQARIGFALSVVANGHIRRITYYPKRLPNATLQAITQP